MPAEHVESPHAVTPVPLLGATDEHGSAPASSFKLQAGSENVVVTANSPGSTETAENEAIAIPTTAPTRFPVRSKPGTRLSYTICPDPALLKLFVLLLL
jgi:hypothetical protein